MEWKLMRARHVVIEPARVRYVQNGGSGRRLALPTGLGFGSSGSSHRIQRIGWMSSLLCCWPAASGRNRPDGRAMSWPVSAHVSLLAYRQVTAKRRPRLD
jgi:hypothetical protein